MQRFAHRLAVCFTGAVLGLTSLADADSADSAMRDRPDATDLGIWKSYAPTDLKGEFSNFDPIGLISGALIKADCSINWADPDTGKVYCFASGTSLNYFQDWPKSYSRRAAEAFERLRKAGEAPGS